MYWFKAIYITCEEHKSRNFWPQKNEIWGDQLKHELVGYNFQQEQTIHQKAEEGAKSVSKCKILSFVVP